MYDEETQKRIIAEHNEALKRLNEHADICERCGLVRKCSDTRGVCEEGEKLLQKVLGR